MARTCSPLPILFLLATLASSTVHGQQLAPGAVVRVKGGCQPDSACETVVGTLVSLDDDRIELRAREGDTLYQRSLADASVYVSTGRRRNTLVGMAAGLPFGIMLGAKEAASCESNGDWFCGSAYGGGAFLGLLVGGAIGWMIRTDRWHRVLPVTAWIQPAGGRMQLGLSVPLRW